MNNFIMKWNLYPWENFSTFSQWNDSKLCNNYEIIYWMWSYPTHFLRHISQYYIRNIIFNIINIIFNIINIINIIFNIIFNIIYSILYSHTTSAKISAKKLRISNNTQQLCHMIHVSPLLQAFRLIVNWDYHYYLFT